MRCKDAGVEPCFWCRYRNTYDNDIKNECWIKSFCGFLMAAKTAPIENIVYWLRLEAKAKKSYMIYLIPAIKHTYPEYKDKIEKLLVLI